MGQSEQYGNGQNRSEGTHGSHQHLESISAKEHFFADRSEHQHDGKKDQASPVHVLVGNWLQVGSAHEDWTGQYHYARDDSTEQPEGEIPSRGRSPSKADI